MSSLKSIKSNIKALSRLLENEGSGVWNSKALYEVIYSDQAWLTGNSSIDQNIVPYLIQEGVLHIVNISGVKSNSTRYALPSVKPEEIILSLRPGSYLSHYSAMYYNGITNSIPKIIYSNLEQFKASPREQNTLEQINIDKAFSKSMRKSNDIARFEFSGESYEAILLHGNKSDNLGVTNISVGKRILSATNIERTLIDAAVRPHYCGGVSEVLGAYKMSRALISIDKLLSYLSQLNFTYPYEQVVGFYLDKASYPEKELKKLEKKISEFDFYLSYEMRSKSYSDRWKLYYPAEME